MLFIGLIPFQTISTLLLQIRKYHTLRILWRNFFCLKNRGRDIFLTNIKSALLIEPTTCATLFFASIFPRSICLFPNQFVGITTNHTFTYKNNESRQPFVSFGNRRMYSYKCECVRTKQNTHSTLPWVDSVIRRC